MNITSKQTVLLVAVLMGGVLGMVALSGQTTNEPIPPGANPALWATNEPIPPGANPALWATNQLVLPVLQPVQTTNRPLVSTNRPLVSTNMPLQSTNRPLLPLQPRR